MSLSDPVNKKAIGIIYIIFSAFWLLSFVFYDQLMEFILSIAEREGDVSPDAYWIFDLINSIFWGIAILFLVPRLVVGIGLTLGQKWANIPGLVFGVISLINFPVGTLLGIYAILVFTAKKSEEEPY